MSLVLNHVHRVSIGEETRQRVFEAARTLDYHPDATGKKLARGRSFTLGLVLRQSPEQVFADALLPQVLLGIEEAATPQGYQVLLKALAPDDTMGYMQLIRENHVDGILLSGPRQDDAGIIRLHQDGFPVMLMGQLPGSGIPSVDINAVADAARAIEHLLGLGHRRIAMITNAPLAYTSAQQRRAGYWKALKEAGTEPNDSYVREGEYTPASGFAAMNELLKVLPSPTAVFVASDVVALGAMQAIKRKGLRIPQDIAMVSFDDIPLAEYYDPPLTSLRLPAYELGLRAGERLVCLAKGERPSAQDVLLESQLITRQSSIGETAAK